jgi:hypothetical protein
MESFFRRFKREEFQEVLKIQTSKATIMKGIQLTWTSSGEENEA